MEFASKLRWILVIAVMVIALILVCWGLFSIAQNIFSGNDEVTTEQQVDFALSSTSVASYSVIGPVVAAEAQRSYRIDVSSSVVSMKVYGNYGSVLLTEKSYTNTAESFVAFTSALSNANATALARGATEEVEFTDIGVCATGRKFIVEFDSTLRRWATSCAGNQGTAGFPMSPVGSLFQRQVPDFSTLNKGTGL